MLAARTATEAQREKGAEEGVQHLEGIRASTAGAENPVPPRLPTQ